MKKNDKCHLHVMVEKYFEGMTTLEEERWLRKALLEAERGDPVIEEAIAVMSYGALSSKEVSGSANSSGIKRNLTRRFSSIAASVIVIASLSTAVMIHHDTSVEEKCVAYVCGEKIDDTDDVRRIAALQIAEFGECIAESEMQILSDFHEFKNVIEL